MENPPNIYQICITGLLPVWHLGVCAYILNGNARTNFCLRKLKMLKFRICSLAIKTERSRWCSRTWTDLKNPKAWFACKHDLENRCFERLEFELNFDLKFENFGIGALISTLGMNSFEFYFLKICTSILNWENFDMQDFQRHKMSPRSIFDHLTYDLRRFNEL